MTELSTLTPLLFIAGCLAIGFLIMGERSRWWRVASALISALTTIRYLYWRLLYTTPLYQNLAQRVWSRLFLTAELMSALSTLLLYFVLSRTIDRSAVVDARRDSPLNDSSVDILIVTYNESREILERTIAGALAIEHRDTRIWLLDDGARLWAQELATSMGIEYVSRYKGKHAKAGNINNGMKAVMARSRRPEFLLLLDADFVANGKILRRTLPLMEEEDVGIVQTPQHFFNHDPVQANLLCTGVWPDEQRFFFNVQMPSRDAWGTAFCCGTSAVLRVKAFEAAGGFATETVTEDSLTTMKFKEHGYRTIFLNEKLSLGLAPETLTEYVSQRSRWCLGSVQQLFTRYSFFGNANMSLLDRLSTFDTLLYWGSNSTFKVLMWLAPVLYWLTGTSVMQADGSQLLYWLGPAFVANLMFMHCYSKNKVLPVMTDVSQMLSATTIFRTVLQGLVRPFGQPFKVTAKGLSAEQTVVHWNLLWPFALTAGLTILGMCMHLSNFSPGHDAAGFGLNMFWSVAGIAMQCLAILACIEPPKRRRSDRYETDEEALVQFGFAKGREEAVFVPCQVRDISLGGAQLVKDDGWAGMEAQGHVILDHGRIQAEFHVVRQLNERTIAIHFDANVDTYRQLLVKLYTTGRYHYEIEKISVLSTFHRLARTLLT